MSHSVRLLPEARAEFDVAADWYEQKQVGLATAFIDRVRDVRERSHPTDARAGVLGRAQGGGEEVSVRGALPRGGRGGHRHRRLAHRTRPVGLASALV